MVWKLKKTSYRFTLVVLASSKNNSSNELGHTVKSNKNGRLFPTTMNNATGKPFDGSTLVRRFTQTWKLMPRGDKNTPNNHDMRSKLFSTKITLFNQNYFEFIIQQHRGLAKAQCRQSTLHLFKTLQLYQRPKLSFKTFETMRKKLTMTIKE